MINIPKSRHLFAISLIASQDSTFSIVTRHISGCAIAHDAQGATAQAWSRIHDECPSSAGWMGHDVSVFLIDNVEWLTEALATETGRTP